ncbi:MAG: hypothetical protein JXQ72_05870 [Anaerolineae bacterium]|nr:hypothetical protein [Anaerolineae bacterium]
MIEGCKGCCAMLLVIPLLLCVGIACVVVFVMTAAPDPPLADNFQPSQADSIAFQNAITTATNDARSQRWFALYFSEKQLSSWLALEGEQFTDKDRWITFSNVQAGLDNGLITVYAEVERYGVTLPLEVVVKPGFTAGGQFKFEIDSASLAGIPMPDAALDMVQEQIDAALDKPFADLPGEYFIYQADLYIEDGIFSVQGGIK